jgi:MoaA/NifB/PqqE/SkfB family radical SAM enzyme
MGPTGDSYRGLQIHPTRQCNLRCRHCYSASAPEERDQLSVALLCAAIDDARAQGYTIANVSGGEPLLYTSLRALLAHARQRGMLTTVTSNGMLLDERRLETLHGVVDVLAISLDGVPASHNTMRGSERAFETMLSRLDGVRRSGIPFGFIFTLTQHNLHELAWATEFAIEQGARLLQIHPLETAGRAATLLPDAHPDELEFAYAYLEVARIRKLVGERLFIQLDLADRELLRRHPERAFADQGAAERVDAPLAELVSPLIIEADASVVPIGYAFARAYALGNLHQARLRDLAAAWRRERYPAFHRLCRRVFDEATSGDRLPFINWYERLAQGAEREQLQPQPS